MIKNPEARKIWFITFVVCVGQGLINGLFLYIWGPYFYDHFSLGGNLNTAITITMLLFAFRQGLVALLEVPTGALADTIGRGHLTILSFAVRSFFFLSLAAIAFCSQTSTAVFWAALASICYAVSYTFFNGAFSAWCADTLRERAPDVPYAWIASRYPVYQSVGELIGAVLSIWLFLHGFPFMAFLFGAIVTYVLIGFSVRPLLREPKVLKLGDAKQINAAWVAREIGVRISEGITVVRKSPVIVWVILVYGAYMFLMSLVTLLWPVYLRTLTGAGGLSNLWIIVAVLGLLLQFGSARLFVLFNDRWTKQNKGSTARFASYRKFYTTSALLCAGAVLVLSLLSINGSPPLPVFVICVGVVMSMVAVLPCFDILVNSLIPSDRAHDRATIVSAGSLVRSVLTLILAVPAGVIGNDGSPLGWSIPAVLLLVAAIGAFVTLRGDERRRLVGARDQVVPERINVELSNASS